MALRNVLILRKPRNGCLEGRMALIQPLANSFTPSCAGGLFFALHSRHPLAFELACSGQDGGFQISLDLARDGGLEPVSVSEARLARYRHR